MIPSYAGVTFGCGKQKLQVSMRRASRKIETTQVQVLLIHWTEDHARHRLILKGLFCNGNHILNSDFFQLGYHFIKIHISPENIFIFRKTHHS